MAKKKIKKRKKPSSNILTEINDKVNKLSKTIEKFLFSKASSKTKKSNKKNLEKRKKNNYKKKKKRIIKKRKK